MTDREALEYLNSIVSSPCENRIVMANWGAAREALKRAVLALAEKVAEER